MNPKNRSRTEVPQSDFLHHVAGWVCLTHTVLGLAIGAVTTDTFVDLLNHGVAAVGSCLQLSIFGPVVAIDLMQQDLEVDVVMATCSFLERGIDFYDVVAWTDYDCDYDDDDDDATYYLAAR